MFFATSYCTSCNSAMYVPSTFQYTQCYIFSNYLQRIKFGAINSATDRGKLSKAIQVPVLIFNMHRMFAAGLDLVDHYQYRVTNDYSYVSIVVNTSRFFTHS